MSNSDSRFEEIEDVIILYGFFKLDNGKVFKSVHEMLALLTDDQKKKLIKRIELGLEKKESDCNGF